MANQYEIEATFTARLILETSNKSITKAKKQVEEFLDRFLNDVEITNLEIKKVPENNTSFATKLMDTKGNVYTLTQPTNAEILTALGEK